jgi:hypothetical protein
MTDKVAVIIRCGDQSHIAAKMRNVLIPFQKRIRALQWPQKLNDRARGRRLTGAGKFAGLLDSFRTALLAPKKFTTLQAPWHSKF